MTTKWTYTINGKEVKAHDWLPGEACTPYANYSEAWIKEELEKEMALLREALEKPDAKNALVGWDQRVEALQAELGRRRDARGEEGEKIICTMCDGLGEINWRAKNVLPTTSPNGWRRVTYDGKEFYRHACPSCSGDGFQPTGTSVPTVAPRRKSKS